MVKVIITVKVYNLIMTVSSRVNCKKKEEVGEHPSIHLSYHHLSSLPSVFIQHDCVLSGGSENVGIVAPGLRFPKAMFIYEPCDVSEKHCKRVQTTRKRQCFLDVFRSPCHNILHSIMPPES